MKTTNTDELAKLEEKVEVFAPEGSFEQQATEVEEGPYYASIEEVMPELAATESDVVGEMEDPTGKEFPVGRRIHEIV